MGQKEPHRSNEAHSCGTTKRLTQAEIFWKLLKGSAHNTHKNTSKTSQNSMGFFSAPSFWQALRFAFQRKGFVDNQ